ncbi:hypothetical protein K474DRAFT_1660931 [Panus rudis PR-1116 ss-1]|nr:hypothetical protein K474DRAFT_1660931 [Panus rudis PR-1116 ss-1]
MTDHTTSSSVETIRGVPLHFSMTPPELEYPSPIPGSPSSLPSPSSPSGESISSLPSVSSSFLFSSGPTTPPQIDIDLNSHQADSDEIHELIIPSLTLPSPVRPPTHYGQTLGDIRLLVLNRSDVDAEPFLRVLTDEHCEDYVSVGPWEELESPDGQRAQTDSRGWSLRISTRWNEYNDAHGLERHEPSRNIEVLHLPEYDPGHDPEDVVRSVSRLLDKPFQAVNNLINSEQRPSSALANFLASPSSSLFTALIYLRPNTSSPLDHRILTELSALVPVVSFPYVPGSDDYPQDLPHTSHPHRRRNLAVLSSFRPDSAYALRAAILRSPETLASLRSEAVERFLHWREAERACRRGVVEAQGSATYFHAHEPTPRVETPNFEWESYDEDSTGSGTLGVIPGGSLKWDNVDTWKRKEGVSNSSTNGVMYSRRGREGKRSLERRLTVTGRNRPAISPPHDDEQSSEKHPKHLTKQQSTSAPSIPLDPLHLPSLLALSASLLSPLKAKFLGFFAIPGIASSGSGGNGFGAGIVLSAFCAGIGLGYLLSRNI